VILTIERRTIAFALPALDGPPPITSPPAFQPPPVANDDDDRGSRAPTVWRFEHDVLRRVTRAVVDHGTSHDGPHDLHVTEAYHGEVAVALRNPADASATATCRFELAWPDVSCAADARLHIGSDATSFHVEIELDTTEDGQPFASRR
jgi:hypothetical protein